MVDWRGLVKEWKGNTLHKDLKHVLWAKLTFLTFWGSVYLSYVKVFNSLNSVKGSIFRYKSKTTVTILDSLTKLFGVWSIPDVFLPVLLDSQERADSKSKFIHFNRRCSWKSYQTMKSNKTTGSNQLKIQMFKANPSYSLQGIIEKTNQATSESYPYTFH